MSTLHELYEIKLCVFFWDVSVCDERKAYFSLLWGEVEYAFFKAGETLQKYKFSLKCQKSIRRLSSQIPQTSRARLFLACADDCCNVSS